MEPLASVKTAPKRGLIGAVSPLLWYIIGRVGRAISPKTAPLTRRRHVERTCYLAGATSPAPGSLCQHDRIIYPACSPLCRVAAPGTYWSQTDRDETHR